MSSEMHKNAADAGPARPLRRCASHLGCVLQRWSPGAVDRFANAARHLRLDRLSVLVVRSRKCCGLTALRGTNISLAKPSWADRPTGNGGTSNLRIVGALPRFRTSHYAIL